MKNSTPTKIRAVVSTRTARRSSKSIKVSLRFEWRGCGALAVSHPVKNGTQVLGALVQCKVAAWNGGTGPREGFTLYTYVSFHCFDCMEGLKISVSP